MSSPAIAPESPPKPGRGPDDWAHFSGNLGVGLLIVLVVQFAHGLTGALEDFAVDTVMQLNALACLHQLSDSACLPDSGKSDGDLLFIDIDEASYNQWKMGDTYHIPRDKVRKLIEYAVGSGARAILVDVDFSRRSAGVGPDAANAVKDDEDLKSYLANYGKDWPDLFLMQTFDPCCMDYPTPEIRPAYFQDAIPEDVPIHWVQPLFITDSHDHEIRRWHLLRAGCFDHRPVWLPSAQLAIDMLLSEERGRPWREIWEGKSNKPMLAKSLPEKCGGEAVLPVDAKIEYGGTEIDLAAERLKQRIVYTVFDKLTHGEAQKGFFRVPAWRIADAGSAAPPPVGNRHGSIIVIGASYQDSHDIHFTPLGNMPGALIILNAIKSLNHYGQLHEAGWIKWLVELGFVFIMAFVFMKFKPWPWLIALTVVAILLLVVVPISFYQFQSGIWVDFLAPFLGMQLHRLWADLEDAKALFKGLLLRVFDKFGLAG